MTRSQNGQRFYDACTMAMLTRAANQGATPGDAVADRWVPLIGPFPFLEILENRFSHKKNRYKVRKNLTKFLVVENQI
jgi:hypothetical protein